MLDSLTSLPQYVVVLIGLGVVVALIVVACFVALAVYKTRFSLMEKESERSVVDGGDKTEMSIIFSEKYKNEGSTGLRRDDLI